MIQSSGRIAAIETLYKGYRFRSRLEARWAVYFDAMGCKWSYEPQGFDLGDLGLYLPDFFVAANPERVDWLNRGSGYWVEIKGEKPTENEVSKLRAVAMETSFHGYIYYGEIGEQTAVSIHAPTGKAIEISNPIGRPISALCSGGDFSQEGHLAAIYKARSARFEHGEQGAA